LNVFLSWSGDHSQQIAATLRDWLPATLQFVKPFYTPNDIEKGARWSSEIAKKLDGSNCGIFILTEENLQSSWMSFEAGAISKKIESSLVCPFIFGMKPGDVVGPFAQFQIAEFNKHETLNLLKTINSAAGDRQLEDGVLNNVFETFWPRLDRDIQSLRPSGVKTERRPTEDILNEILVLNRTIASSLGNSVSDPEFKEKLARFVWSFDLVFHHDWDHSLTCIQDPEGLISRDGSFIHPMVSDESNNWGNRGSLLYAYRDLMDFCRKRGVIQDEPH
jgi:hypothetical protein